MEQSAIAQVKILLKKTKPIFDADLGLSNCGSDPGLRLAYLYGTMGRKLHLTKINGRSLGAVVLDCLWLNDQFGVSLDQLKEGRSSRANFFPFENLAEPFRQTSTTYCCLCNRYRIELNTKAELIILDEVIRHEIVHYLIVAPLDIFGDFLVASVMARTSKQKQPWTYFQQVANGSRYRPKTYLSAHKEISVVMNERQEFLTECIEHFATQIIEGKLVSSQELESIGRANQLRINRFTE